MDIYSLNDLNNDICAITKSSNIKEALFNCGILLTIDENFEIEPISSIWERRGAETYIYQYRIVFNARQTNHIIIKACVTQNIGTPISMTVDNWINRRLSLQKLGVNRGFVRNADKSNAKVKGN